MDKEFNKKFLAERDKTGRFIVKSLRTGRTYYVEPIDSNNRSDWGDLDPVTKKMTGNYGTKYKGSIKPEESLITEENGFTKIHNIGVGESPLSYIEKIDNQYPDYEQ
jgi:hypothetical protein